VPGRGEAHRAIVIANGAVRPSGCVASPPEQRYVADASSAPPWHAELALRFTAARTRTELAEARHSGPLRVQRVLHPEADACECLVLHPPGGIAGGDTLHIDITLERGAQVLLSTPGASKWYRSAGRAAMQRVALCVAAEAVLEWLPQEAILFRDADAHQSLEIELAAGASCIGWDLVQLGRIAANESWDVGRLRQSISLRRDGELRWHEHADFSADDPLLDAPTGLAGQRVFGTLWATSSALDADFETALGVARGAAASIITGHGLQSRPDSEQSSLCVAATWLAAPVGLLLVRVVGDDAERARAALEAAWSALRPWIAGRAGRRPRIWST
jgi:urease accessory protein